MALHQLLVIIIFLLFRIGFTVNRFITTHDFEAENGVCSGQCKQMMRSAASDGLTVFIELGDKLNHSMEIKSNCSISVENCRYSTDGPLPDTVSISLANTDVGSFITISRNGNGHLWNVFKDSGPVGQHLQLPSGHYDLILLLSVDNYGVEIDKTTLNFNCDADPGQIETSHVIPNDATTEITVPDHDFLSVGEILGIVTAASTIVGTIVGVVSAAVTAYFKYVRVRRVKLRTYVNLNLL